MISPCRRISNTQIGRSGPLEFLALEVGNGPTVYKSNRRSVVVASVDGSLCILVFLPAVVDEQGFFSFPR